jgi:hypothetical protein
LRLDGKFQRKDREILDSMIINKFLVSIVSIVFLANCGGESATPTPPSETITEAPPEITTALLSIVEHTTTVGSIAASDVNGDSISYSISGGDSDELSISSSGLVEFNVAPDYEVKDTYSFTVTASDGTLNSTKDIAISVTNYALLYEAKEKLIFDGRNIPVTNPIENLCIVGLDVPDSQKNFCNEVYALIHQTLGGYPNYIYLIWNENGTEADAKPVTDKISDIENASISLSDLAPCCLCGYDKGTRRTSTTNPYSLCFVTSEWVAAPFFSDGSQFIVDIQLSLHYAHEYYHHFQVAHGLERGLDFQQDNDNPLTTVNSPRWYIEAAAVTFQNAWFKENFTSISSFANSTWDDVKYTTIAKVASDEMYKSLRRSIRGADGEKSDGCDANWLMTSVEEVADTQTRCTDGSMMALSFLAYKTSYKTVWVDMPKDYYDLGFYGALEKYYGKTTQEFYDDYNAFLRLGNAEDSPPTGWAPNDNDIIAADFLNMVPEGL